MPPSYSPDLDKSPGQDTKAWDSNNSNQDLLMKTLHNEIDHVPEQYPDLSFTNTVDRHRASIGIGSEPTTMSKEYAHKEANAQIPQLEQKNPESQTPLRTEGEPKSGQEIKQDENSKNPGDLPLLEEQLIRILDQMAENYEEGTEHPDLT